MKFKYLMHCVIDALEMKGAQGENPLIIIRCMIALKCSSYWIVLYAYTAFVCIGLKPIVVIVGCTFQGCIILRI